MIASFPADQPLFLHQHPVRGCPKLTGTYFSLFQTTQDTKSTKSTKKSLRVLRGEKITCFWTTPKSLLGPWHVSSVTLSATERVGAV